MWFAELNVRGFSGHISFIKKFVFIILIILILISIPAVYPEGTLSLYWFSGEKIFRFDSFHKHLESEDHWPTLRTYIHSQYLTENPMLSLGRPIDKCCIGREVTCFWQKTSRCVLTNCTMYYIPSVHNTISVQWYNIYSQVTLRLHVSTVNDHLRANY